MIGLGGGSNMDTAKLAALVLAHGGDPLDYTGDCRVPGPVKPLICIPTTAGTGSEVSAAAVFTDTANHIKVSCLSPFLRPAFAIVDPLLTVSCPPKVTADSGIDALTHAIEAFTAVDNDDFPLPSGEKSVYQGKNPMADAMAREAIALVGKFLRRAVKDGNDLEARDGMALAATLGGLAFSNVGVALVHAMEYPVGGAVHVSHGAGNGLLLPFVMRFNLEQRVPEFAQIRRFLGSESAPLPRSPPPDAISPNNLAEKAIQEIEQLREDIGIPDASARHRRDGGHAPRLRGEGVRHQAAHARQPANAAERGRNPGASTGPRSELTSGRHVLGFCAELRMPAWLPRCTPSTKSHRQTTGPQSPRRSSSLLACPSWRLAAIVSVEPESVPRPHRLSAGRASRGSSTHSAGTNPYDAGGDVPHPGR